MGRGRRSIARLESHRSASGRRSDSVECRAASCGTCWVGVLGGAEKLSDVGAREGKKIKEFGYTDTAEPQALDSIAPVRRRRTAQSRSSFRRGTDSLTST